MSVEEWEKNKEGFRYDPPEEEPEMWGTEEYTRLYDRIISRHVRWECQKCSKPFSSLERARSHVETQHSEQLISKAVRRQEDS